MRGSRQPPSSSSLAPPGRAARRRVLRGAACLAAAALLLAVAVPTARAEIGAESRVIVKYREGSQLLRRVGAARRLEADAGSAAALGRRRGLSLRAVRSLGDRVQVVAGEGTTAEVLARELAREPDLEYAVPDRVRRPHAPPNDPYYAAGPPILGASGGPAVGQWYLRAAAGEVRSGIDVETAWLVTRGSPSVVVAVIDTGVRFDHADLRHVSQGGALLDGYDFVGDDFIGADGQPGRDGDASDPGDYVTPAHVTDPRNRICTWADLGDSSWHGTKVAGLVGATAGNGIGISGVAPGARILPVRVLGRCGGWDSDIVAGMLWAAGVPVPGAPPNPTPARVLNLSLGGADACGALYQDVVNQINARGALVVASAGNGVGHAVGVPANCNGVLAVAGLRHAGTKVGFSDLGPEISLAAPAGNCVNVGPGEACLYPMMTTTNGGATIPLSDAAGGSRYTDSFAASYGTSFAAPLAAGAAALMLSARPGLTPAQLWTTMRATARPFPTTGGDNGDGSVVPQCQIPRPLGQPQLDQLQCYCNAATCGAGMLDVGAAVLAANPIAVRLDAQLSPPQLVGTPVPLAATASGGRGAYEFKWWASPDGGRSWTSLLDWSAAGAHVWTPGAAGDGWQVAVWVRTAGRTADTPEAWAVLAYRVTAPPPARVASLVPSLPSPQLLGTAVDWTAVGADGTGAWEFKWWASSDGERSWTLLRDWGPGTVTWTPGTAGADWRIGVWVRSAGAAADVAEGWKIVSYHVTSPDVVGLVTLRPALPAPQLRGTAIDWTASAAGGRAPHEFKWWTSPDGGRSWSLLRDWGAGTVTWTPGEAGSAWRIGVWARSAGSTVDAAEGWDVASYVVEAPPPARVASLVPSVSSPQRVGTTVDWTAAGAGGTGAWEFKWWASPDGGRSWTLLRDWGAGAVTWTPATAGGAWRIAVWVRSAGALADAAEGWEVAPYVVEAPPPLRIAAIEPTVPSPALAGSAVSFQAVLEGGVGAAEVKWWLSPDGGASWQVLADWGAASVTWLPAVPGRGYRIGAWVRAAGSRADAPEHSRVVPYRVRSPLPAPPEDYDGDGRSDLFAWLGDGDVVVLLLQGSRAVDGGVATSVLDPSWIDHAIADANGDGTADRLWHHTSTGALYIWRMRGASVAGAERLPNLPWPFAVLETGDFDGDGSPDLLWWNLLNGEVGVWLLDGAALRQSATLGAVPPLAAPDGCVADFDDDGRDDLLWMDGASGGTVHLLDGASVRGTWSVPAAPAGWTLLDCGDFSGDRRADVAWQTATPGSAALWAMNGGAAPPTTVPLSLGSHVREAVEIGDYDGDRSLDLLWVDSFTSDLGILFLDRLTARSSAMITP